MIDRDSEWDDAKAASNLSKHGVSFEMARAACLDPFALELNDPDSYPGEDRFICLGSVASRVLFVAYALRGDRIRIISARRATRYERRRYNETNQYERF